MILDLFPGGWTFDAVLAQISAFFDEPLVIGGIGFVFAVGLGSWAIRKLLSVVRDAAGDRSGGVEGDYMEIPGRGRR